MTAPLLTSLTAIRAHRPCADGWATLTWWLMRTHGITDPDTRWPLAWIIDSNGRADAMWSLRTTNPVLCRLVACDAAESVLPRFETRYPADRRPRHAIETARRFALGRATETELRFAGLAATVSAAADTYAAAYACTAAYTAAYAAASTAAYTAAYAAAYAWTERLRAWLNGHLPPAAEPYRSVIHARLWRGVP